MSPLQGTKRGGAGSGPPGQPDSSCLSRPAPSPHLKVVSTQAEAYFSSRGKEKAMVGDPRAGSGARGLGQADVGSNTHTHIKTHTQTHTYRHTQSASNTAVSEIISASFHAFTGSGRFPGVLPRRPHSQGARGLPQAGFREGVGGGRADQEGCKLGKPNWPTAPRPAAGRGAGFTPASGRAATIGLGPRVTGR